MSAICLTLALTCFNPHSLTALPFDNLDALLNDFDFCDPEACDLLLVPVPYSRVRLERGHFGDEGVRWNELKALVSGGRRTGDERAVARVEPPPPSLRARLGDRSNAFHSADISRTRLFCILQC